MTPATADPSLRTSRGFFALLRSIETAHPHLPRLGCATTPRDEPVRLGQSPSLAFATSTLASVSRGEAGRPWSVRVRFFGLWGPHGPMPLHLSDQVRERARRRPADRASCRFADLFHHRLLLLLYRAWADAEPAVGADRARHPGAVEPSGARRGDGRQSIPVTRIDDPFGRRAAALSSIEPLPGPSTAGVSAAQIEAGLAQALDAPVRVAPWFASWLEVPAAECCRLGRLDAAGCVGRGAVLGGRVRDASSTLRLRIGPLPTERLRRVLGGAAMSGAAEPCDARDDIDHWRRLMRRAVPVPLAVEWRLCVEPHQPTACSIGGPVVGRSPALGVATWLGRPRPHAEDVGGRL